MSINNYHDEFYKSLNSIDKLVSTPNLMQEIVLKNLQTFDKSSFKESQKQKFNLLIQTIQNIAKTSMADSYNVIYNQVCILSVSALSATIEKYFINYANSNWKRFKTNPQKIKLSLEDLGSYNLNVNPALGQIIIDKDNSINFQDLKSTLKAFKDYFNKEILIDNKTLTDVIFYQQSRHILVHKNGLVDNSFLSRVADYNIKNMRIGDSIILDSNDWKNIKSSFQNLVKAIIPQPPLIKSDEGRTYYLDQSFED